MWNARGRIFYLLWRISAEMTFYLDTKGIQNLYRLESLFGRRILLLEETFYEEEFQCRTKSNPISQFTLLPFRLYLFLNAKVCFLFTASSSSSLVTSSRCCYYGCHGYYGCYGCHSDGVNGVIISRRCAIYRHPDVILRHSAPSRRRSAPSSFEKRQ